MSYVSLLKNIPEFLSQPTGIAAIASLGIHGVIAFVLPMVPVDSKTKQEPSSKSNVGLVELSQAEKNRLPQPGTPQLSSLQPSLQPLPPVLPQVPPANFANQPTPSLPPMPPSAASTQLILPPLPKTNNIAVASLPKSQSLPVLSKRDLQPEPSLSTKVKPFTPYVEKVKLREPKPLESSRVPYNVPPVQAANIPQEQELVNTYAAPVSSDQMPVAPSSEASTATQTTEPGGVAQNQQLVTPVVQPPQVGDNSIALRGQNLPQLPQGSNLKVPLLPSLAAESPAVLSEQLASKPKTFVERFSEAKNQYPNLETKQPVAAIVNAKAGQEGNVQGDLVVNSQGQVESINFENNAIASDLKTEVREYFREYFQKNPTQANGKPKLYPFNISFKSDSSSISKTSAPELSTRTQVNQTQPITATQRSLIQRLRSVEGSSQLSREPQKANPPEPSRPVEVNSLPSPQKVNLTQRLRPVEVNSLPSPQKVNLRERSGSSSVNQQLSQRNQTASAPQANQEQQTSRQRVVVRQTTSAPQPNREQQTSRQQVVVRQSASSSQTDKEQQTSQQRVVVRQSASSSQTDKEQQTSRQQVVVRQSPSESQTNQEQTNQEQTSQQQVSSNQSSGSVESSKKLLQQLRQIRDQRQGSNQEQ